MSDSGKYSGFGYPDIRVPVEITNFDSIHFELFVKVCIIISTNLLRIVSYLLTSIMGTHVIVSACIQL